jgi:hypothetical protein
VTVPQIYTVIVLAALGATVCAWQVRRALREPSERDRIVAEARARTGLADHMPGIDTALQDACELIWNLPAHGTPDPDLNGFCDRLRDAIHDHRKEEGP